jgi:hypothetical protein
MTTHHTEFDSTSATVAMPESMTTRNSSLSIPLTVHSRVASRQQPIAVGLPLPRGAVLGEPNVCLTDQQGHVIASQSRCLSRWSDGSVKWLLVDAVAESLPAGQAEWEVSLANDPNEKTTEPRISVCEENDVIVVDTGYAKFEIDRATFRPFRRVEIDGRSIVTSHDSETLLTDRKGRPRRLIVDNTTIDTHGPLRATITLGGKVPGCRGLRFRARLCFFAGTGLVRVRLALHNPNRARHRGGLWDLGDAGSVLFRGLSMNVGLTGDGNSKTQWKCDPDEPPQEDVGAVEIYQDSSGGKNWQSLNHVNRDGVVPCRFRGYEVTRSIGTHRGERASPTVTVRTDGASLTVSVPEFWQQFPKAINAGQGTTRIGLFPEQWNDLFELQGGERKTHTVWLSFSDCHQGDPNALDWTHQPARVVASPEWYAASGVVPYLSPVASDRDDRMRDLMDEGLNGPRSFFAKRETIDEYGWRHFGEIWADHEERYYDGPEPVISHYNNQYDVVNGSIQQLMRTGDPKWFDLFDPLARHVMDIDIYHTTRDKAAYNHGLFWHTDHYSHVAGATHRCFTRENVPKDGSPYGGGPGAQHNYATGLMHYYYMTGDSDAAEAVLGLADWVIEMEDGAKNVLGLVDDGPTGRISEVGTAGGHGPGRGGANAIDVLVDALLLSGETRYMAKVEALIRQCIHPRDDLELRDLLNAEESWSYTMFLSAVDRYLTIKAERDQIDEMYAYAQQSVLHYARWMVTHERPYFDDPEQLEFPTETWGAQEMRKANVLRLAAAHATESEVSGMIEKADELTERAWHDLLRFDSRVCTRPLALMMAEGTRSEFLRTSGASQAEVHAGDLEFGVPQSFVSQKQRVLARVNSPLGTVHVAIRLMRPTAIVRLMGFVARRFSR